MGISIIIQNTKTQGQSPLFYAKKRGMVISIIIQNKKTQDQSPLFYAKDSIIGQNVKKKIRKN